MGSTLSLYVKRELILEREKQFCHRVSTEIIEKPKLGVWMILIPVFFVFYFWQLQRYSEGRKEFSANYLISRERALNSACEAVENNRDVDLTELVQASDAPEETQEHYRNWLALLADHYMKLLSADGATYNELVQAEYKTRKSYARFFDSLNRAEQAFNDALQPHVDGETPEVSRVVNRIKTVSIRLRKEEVKEIFS